VVAIHIRDVPETLRDELAAQAQAEGKSLQRYVLGLLTREADAGHRERLLADWARVPLAAGSRGLDAADYIRQQREEWEQEMTRRILAPRE
jgi:hypothetical protein